MVSLVVKLQSLVFRDNIDVVNEYFYINNLYVSNGNVLIVSHFLNILSILKDVTLIVNSLQDLK